MGQSGGYALKQSRVPPDLVVAEATTINESETLSLPLSAQDPDIPDKTLTFALLSAPAGMVIQANGPTNATVTWPTTIRSCRTGMRAC